MGNRSSLFADGQGRGPDVDAVLARARAVLEQEVAALLDGEVFRTQWPNRPFMLWRVQVAAMRAAGAVADAINEGTTGLLAAAARQSRRLPRADVVDTEPGPRTHARDDDDLAELAADLGSYVVAAATFGVLHTVTTAWADVCRDASLDDERRLAVFACLHGIAFYSTTNAEAAMNRAFGSWDADALERRRIPRFAGLLSLDGTYQTLLRGDVAEHCRIVTVDAVRLAASFEDFRHRALEMQRTIDRGLARQRRAASGRFRPY